jgi:hypothetical protein
MSKNESLQHFTSTVSVRRMPSSIGELREPSELSL